MALAALAAGGCIRADGFVCATSDQCVEGGLAGTCEPDGACSFPDTGCPSGRRYGERSAGGLAGTCVGGGGSIDGGDDIDAGPPGSFVWQRPLSTSFCDVRIDDFNRPVIAASFTGTIDLGGGPLTNEDASGLYLARFDADGEHEMSVAYGGVGDEFQTEFFRPDVVTLGVAGLWRGVGNVGGSDLGDSVGFQGFAAAYSLDGEHLWSMPFLSAMEVFLREAAGDGAGGMVGFGDFKAQLSYAGTTADPTGSSGDSFLAYVNATAARDIEVIGSSGGIETGNALAADGAGNVFVVGTFDQMLTLAGQTFTSQGSRDVYYARFAVDAAAGTLTAVWSRAAPGPLDSGLEITAVADGGGNLIMAGSFQGTITFTGGPTLTSAGGTDIYVVKVDGNANHVWSQRFGGTGNDFPRGIAVGQLGEIAIAGEFVTPITFGGDVFDPVGDRDGFVVKLDATGGHVWSRAFGGPMIDRGLEVALDQDGHVYLCASYADGTTVSFGGEALTAVGGINSVLLKYQ